MPWNLGPSVTHRNGRDYWRTWFIEECDESQLFGATESHLPLITHYGSGVVPYAVGTELYLEDAPYFRASKRHHRVCGPYRVFSPDPLPPGAVRVFPEDGPVVVFKEPHPEQGPWLDRSSVRRQIEGLDVRFQQIAKRFAFFPFRFAIRHAPNFKVQLPPHQEPCWLCR